MTPENELRRALTLSCHDALRCTTPLHSDAVDAIAQVLHRLVMSEPVTLDVERAMLDLLDDHCERVPPFEHSILSEFDPDPSWGPNDE